MNLVKKKWRSLTLSQKEAHLAKRATPAEIRLRYLLDHHPLTVGRYQFQKCVEGYFPDFSFPHAKLIVELDGACHRGRAAHVRDGRRSAKLAKKGWKVVRFWNSQLARPVEVMAKIVELM